LIDDLLLFVKIAIDNNDRALFGKTIIKIYNHIGYGFKKTNYGRFLLIVAVYMYYYCLREPLVRREDSDLRSQLFSQDLRKSGYHFSFKDICQKKGETLLVNFVEVINFFKTDHMFWEIMPEGEGKFLQIHQITKEFIAFYLFYYGKYYHLFELEFQRSSLEDLTELYTIIKAVSNGDEETTRRYEQFYQWIDKNETLETKPNNHWLLACLEKVIKDKIFTQAKEYREKREVRHKRLDEIFNEAHKIASQ